MMTTVAFDGKEVACDTLITRDGVVDGYADKYAHVPGGLLLMAGDCADWVLVTEWFKGGKDPDKKPTLDGSIYLFIPEDGTTPKEYNYRLVPLPTSVPWAAGTGRDFAKAAMLLGKTAREAVEFACTQCVFSGGDIISFKVK